MGVVNMSKEIKKIHSEFVILYKVGSFIQCFGKDAYIMCYIFDYNIQNTKEDIPTCGFPKKSISKIIAKLEHKKINYLIIDTRNNYDVDEKSENGNLNTYNEIIEKAQRYVKLRRKINKISETLIKEIEHENIIEKIKKIEEITYESRKI